MDNFFLGVLMLVVLVNSVHGKCDGGYWCCGGDYLCGQGEGDCDNDNECLPGLKCDFDGWFGRDYCKAGPNTRNYAWADWEDWSECSVACGGDGTKTRTRSCIPPSNGGFDCPTNSQTETADCNNGPCPIDGAFSEWDDWTECSVSCGGGGQTRSRRCDNPAPQFGGLECVGELTECQECNIEPCASQCPAK